MIEYKGEDRLSNDDTAWKKQLGELWQQFTGNKHHFYLVGKKDTVDVIKAIENIK